MSSRFQWLKDKYIMRIGVLVFVLFCFYVISNNLHHSRGLFILSPINWLLVSPIGSTAMDILGPLVIQPWWVYCETLISTAIWLMLYFGIRGIFYSFTEMNAYFAIAIFIIVMMLSAFIVWVVLPTLDQVNEWWNYWPGREAGYIK